MERTSTLEEIFSANLAEFFHNSNVGLAVFDPQLRYQALNPRLAEINGLSVESHLGKTLYQILGEEVAFRAEPALKQVLATGQAIANFELAGTLPTKTEAERWLDNFFPIKDSKGRVTQVGAVVVEIPAGKSAEKSGLNYGITPAATVMRSWKEIAHYMGACVKTVQRWEQAYKFPIRRLRASKGVEVFALRDEVDRWIVSKAQSARMDIPDERSWAMFTNSPPPTLIVNDEREILDANATVAHLIGMAKNELVGKKLDSFACGSGPEHIEREWALFRKLAGSVGLRNFCRADGTIFAAEYTLRTLLPGIRILTLTALSRDPVCDQQPFYQAGPTALER